VTNLILKRAAASRLSGEWNDDDVLCEGAVVGRIMKAAAAPVGTPWLLDAGLWPPRGPHPEARERADARGCNGRVR
jgi:hypothetical protein